MVVQLIPPDFTAQPWTDQLAGSPFTIPINTIVPRSFQLNPSTRFIMVAIPNVANAVIVNVIGGATGLTYFTFNGAQPAGPWVVAVVPAIDSFITVSVQAGASGTLTCFVAALEDDISSPPGTVAGSVTLGPPQDVPFNNVLDGRQSTGYAFGSYEYMFNGTNWDRVRGNTSQLAINAVAATTSQTTGVQTNYNARGIRAILTTTAIGTGSITLHIQGLDDANALIDDLLVGAAVTTNTHIAYKVYPGLPATANVSANDVLPRFYVVQVIANNANPATYGVTTQLIL